MIEKRNKHEKERIKKKKMIKQKKQQKKEKMFTKKSYAKNPETSSRIKSKKPDKLPNKLGPAHH
jgi:hypothetical protein